MKFLTIMLAAFAIYLNGCKHTGPITITPFVPYNKMDDTLMSYDSTKMFVYKDEMFLVSNYSNTKQTEKLIDRFCDSLIKTKEKMDYYVEYRLYFFKETAETNLESIKRNPRDIDRYSFKHDYIFYYAFHNKKLLEKDKYSNGKQIDPEINVPSFRFEKEPNDTTKPIE